MHYFIGNPSLLHEENTNLYVKPLRNLKPWTLKFSNHLEICKLENFNVQQKKQTHCIVQRNVQHEIKTSCIDIKFQHLRLQNL
jgi:hypothetical protein